MNAILLDLLAFGSVLSGILVITSRNPIISVLFLIAVFVNVACYLILLGINFIGITYILLYVGAIAILFLFVIMMLNVREGHITEDNTMVVKHYPLAFILGTIFWTLFSNTSLNWNVSSIYSLFDYFNLLGSNVGSNQVVRNNLFSTINYPLWDGSFIEFGQIQSIGFVLYTSHLLWILLCSAILLLAMVGPIVLTSSSK